MRRAHGRQRDPTQHQLPSQTFQLQLQLRSLQPREVHTTSALPVASMACVLTTHATAMLGLGAVTTSGRATLQPARLFQHLLPTQRQRLFHSLQHQLQIRPVQQSRHGLSQMPATPASSVLASTSTPARTMASRDAARAIRVQRTGALITSRAATMLRVVGVRSVESVRGKPFMKSS